ncbi:MAG: hypothetical protein ACK4VO_12275 [Pseudobdellovibrio sp.]
MKQLALSQFTDTHLTVIAMMIFLGYFLIIGIKAISMSFKQVELYSNMPLQEDIEVKNER